MSNPGVSKDITSRGSDVGLKGVRNDPGWRGEGTKGASKDARGIDVEAPEGTPDTIDRTAA